MVLIALAQGFPVDAVCASVADVCRRKSTSAACKSSGYVKAMYPPIYRGIGINRGICPLPMACLSRKTILKVHLVVWVWVQVEC